MILNSIAKSIRKQDWSVVFIELLLLIIGLLLAFQVDRWWEDRKDRAREQDYLSRLIIEVEESLEQIRFAIDLAEVRQGFGDFLLEVMANPDAAKEQPSLFLVSIAQAAFTYSPHLTSHAFQDLSATGNMGLIQNPEIKRELYEFYGFHDDQRQFIQLNLNIEFRYFELAAEILTAEQYQWVQDQWFVVTKDTLDEVYAAQADLQALPQTIEIFMENRALQDWIPRTRGIQREQILMNGALRKRGEKLLESLKNESNEEFHES